MATNTKSNGQLLNEGLAFINEMNRLTENHVSVDVLDEFMTLTALTHPDINLALLAVIQFTLAWRVAFEPGATQAELNAALEVGEIAAGETQ